MAEKLATPEGRKRCARRKWLSEAPNGWIKEAMGFRRFSVRGLAKVRGEWDLVCLALNLRRMKTLMAAWMAGIRPGKPRSDAAGGAIAAAAGRGRRAGTAQAASPSVGRQNPPGGPANGAGKPNRGLPLPSCCASSQERAQQKAS